MIKGRKRHLFVYKVLRAAAGPWFKRMFNYQTDMADIGMPYLVLANHNTDYDPFLLALGFKQQIYFVASEHIFRWGLLSKLIGWLFAPISRLKGRTASGTVMTVMRRLRDGANVAIFAEGDKSWNGETCGISRSTAKLARSCGATLVTFRLEGGYLSAPRWSKNKRRGSMRGSVVGIYEPETLKSMSVDELMETVEKDLYENAYVRQDEAQISFNGRNLAEDLETALCVCPKCGALGLLRSRGDRFFCTGCGMETRYTSKGFFDGGIFKTVLDWDKWQTKELRRIVMETVEGPIFCDSNVSLKEISDKYSERKLGQGKLTLYRDRMECAGHAWRIEDISGMALHGRMGMNVAVGDRNFEIISHELCCMRKYLTAHKTLKGELSWIIQPQTQRSGT